MLDSGTRVVWALELFAESASSSGIAEALGGGPAFRLHRHTGGGPFFARFLREGWGF